MSNLREQIEREISFASAESGSDTPDHVLAEFLTDCLAAFDKAVKERETWYGRGPVFVNPLANIKPTGTIDLEQAQQALTMVLKDELESEIISAEVLSFRMKSCR